MTWYMGFIKNGKNVLRAKANEMKEEKPKEQKPPIKMRIELKEGQTIQDLYDLRLWIWAKAERMGFNVLDQNTSLE